MNKFRAYAEDELPNLEFRNTKEEALTDTINRVASDRSMAGSHPPTIIVEEVREAILSDFFDFNQLVSLMRESMQERIGNDDALSDGLVVSNLFLAAEPAIADILDAAADTSKLRIDGYIVVSSYRAERWWVHSDAET